MIPDEPVLTHFCPACGLEHASSRLTIEELMESPTEPPVIDTRPGGSLNTRMPFPPAKDPTPLPTVGRIVHYVSAGSKDGRYPSVCRAAIVTAVDPDMAYVTSLTVFNPEGLHFVSGIYMDATAQLPMTWHYPERA